MKKLHVNFIMLSLLAIFTFNIGAVDNKKLARPVAILTQKNKSKLYNALLTKFPALKKLNTQKAVNADILETFKKHKITLPDIKSVKVTTLKTYPKNNPISKYRIIVTTKKDIFTIKPSKTLKAKNISYQVTKEKVKPCNCNALKDTFSKAMCEKYGC